MGRHHERRERAKLVTDSPPVFGCVPAGVPSRPRRSTYAVIRNKDGSVATVGHEFGYVQQSLINSYGWGVFYRYRDRDVYGSLLSRRERRMFWSGVVLLLVFLVIIFSVIAYPRNEQAVTQSH